METATATEEINTVQSVEKERTPHKNCGVLLHLSILPAYQAPNRKPVVARDFKRYQAPNRRPVVPRDLKRYQAPGIDTVIGNVFFIPEILHR